MAQDDNLIPQKTHLSTPAFMAWHHVLRPMRRTIEPMLDTGDPRAFSILGRLAILNGKSSFWQDEEAA